MSGIRKRGEEIRQFIINNIDHHSKDITALTVKKFNISRPAVYKHIKSLINQKAIIVHGKTKDRYYKLHHNLVWEHTYTFDKKIDEDIVWRNDIVEHLKELPENVLDIWQFGFTEMFNNVIDHSLSTIVTINLEKTATTTKIIIYDNGEGIFKKIKRELNLEDERHSLLELSKGKLTTDPENHTGEGIFFSSRMFDDFAIISGNVFFSHKFDEIEDWVVEHSKFQQGTGVVMSLKNNTSRTTKEIFDKYSSGDDYGFNKTVVPVKLVLYGNEKLVSRSQAKRLLARIDKFKIVIFNFEDIDTIGQAFADEVFRVFAKKNPHIELVPIKTNKYIDQMIMRAKSNL